MLADNKLTLPVERQAVGADGSEAGDVALEHRVDQGACPLGLGPLIDDVVLHVGEQEPGLVPDPNRPFGEDEPVGQPLDSGIVGNQGVETRVDTQDEPGTGVGCLIRRPTGRGYDEGDQHVRESQSLHRDSVRTPGRLPPPPYSSSRPPCLLRVGPLRPGRTSTSVTYERGRNTRVCKRPVPHANSVGLRIGEGQEGGHSGRPLGRSLSSLRIGDPNALFESGTLLERGEILPLQG